MNWYAEVLGKYATFGGRARRKEYWMFALFNTIFTIVAMILDGIFALNRNEFCIGPIYIIYALATVIPSFAVFIRRLHDVGQSGWITVIALIPVIGTIFILILLMLDGSVGENKYGPDPKY